MEPYVIQNFKSELGEIASARQIQGRSGLRAQRLTGTEASFAAEDRTVYEGGQLTSLTVTSFPVPGEFTLVFTSGETATTLTVPQTLVMPVGFAVNANTRYEINVLDGYALCAGWAVTGS